MAKNAKQSFLENLKQVFTLDDYGYWITMITIEPGCIVFKNNLFVLPASMRAKYLTLTQFPGKISKPEAVASTPRQIGTLHVLQVQLPFAY